MIWVFVICIILPKLIGIIVSIKEDLKIKINAIKSPISIDIPTAPMTRASPILYPNTLAVKIIARILMAGPEKRKVVAGPIPAPRL